MAWSNDSTSLLAHTASSRSSVSFIRSYDSPIGKSHIRHGTSSTASPISTTEPPQTALADLPSASPPKRMHASATCPSCQSVMLFVTRRLAALHFYCPPGVSLTHASYALANRQLRSRRSCYPGLLPTAASASMASRHLTFWRLAEN